VTQLEIRRVSLDEQRPNTNRLGGNASCPPSELILKRAGLASDNKYKAPYSNVTRTSKIPKIETSRQTFALPSCSLAVTPPKSAPLESTKKKYQSLIANFTVSCGCGRRVLFWEQQSETSTCPQPTATNHSILIVRSWPAYTEGCE